MNPKWFARHESGHKSNRVVLNQLTRLLAVQLRQTEDILLRNMLQASAAVINCSNGVNGDVPTELTTPDIETVIQVLAAADAETLMNNIEAENRFGTGPIRWSYIAMMHSNLIPSLQAVQGFLHASQYPSTQSVLQSEWGNVQNIRFLQSSIGAVALNSSALGADVYSIFIAANESYANVKQNRYTSSFVYRPPIFSDALAQNASVGWKTANAQVITNDTWVLNLRCTLP